MKATLELDLNDHADKHEHQLMLNAFKLYKLADDFREWLRQELKYREDKYTEQQLDTLEAVREKFWELGQENYCQELFE